MYVRPQRHIASAHPVSLKTRIVCHAPIDAYKSAPKSLAKNTNYEWIGVELDNTYTHRRLKTLLRHCHEVISINDVTPASSTFEYKI